MSSRRRLDVELVRRGLAPSRQVAQRVIEAGGVTVGGAPATKPARLVGPGEAVLVLGDPARFVSRGGDKLDAALDRFAIDVAAARVIDIGASTGGFTDCVLQRGALEVVAVDVGYGQMHERLRADPRVHVRERTDVRSITAEGIGGPGQVLVADLSFISVRSVSRNLVRLVESGGSLVVLVKPQFEAGRQEVSKGRGVIRDPEIWLRTLEAAISQLRADGAAIMEAMPSPITGAKGNVEFLVHGRTQASPSDLDGSPQSPSPGPLSAPDIAAVVAEACAQQGPAQQGRA